ncbi:hypothetical protein [Brasilonema octagenarum]|uniref:hypothetical protein n=1 Tax=Brasilonema octagenarum TaxID=417105 RepID=UPI001B7D27D1|nr:hypothetical protein [Brasilonema octagenarum]
MCAKLHLQRAKPILNPKVTSQSAPKVCAGSLQMRFGSPSYRREQCRGFRYLLLTLWAFTSQSLMGDRPQPSMKIYFQASRDELPH